MNSWSLMVFISGSIKKINDILDFEYALCLAMWTCEALNTNAESFFSLENAMKITVHHVRFISVSSTLHVLVNVLGTEKHS